VVEAIAAAVLGAVVAGLLSWLVARRMLVAQRRASETDRVRNNLTKYIRDVSVAHRWLREDVAPAASDPSNTNLTKYWDEARLRATALYSLWDEIKVELQNAEIISALDEVHMIMDPALNQVRDGNLSPDLTGLKERRDRLADLVKKRLAVRL
jgi:hypothetical protein